MKMVVLILLECFKLLVICGLLLVDCGLMSGAQNFIGAFHVRECVCSLVVCLFTYIFHISATRFNVIVGFFINLFPVGSVYWTSSLHFYFHFQCLRVCLLLDYIS